MEWRFERMHPRELEEARDRCPAAFVPLGSLEFHGRHLPVGLDALKAHALCGRIVEALGGGVVLPPLFCGTGGGHLGFEWTIMHDEAVVEAVLRRTLEKLADNGYRVAVVLTGHYPGEQTDLVARVGQAVMAACEGFTVFALPEWQADPAGEACDHAAKWETSIMLALMPELVHMDRLERAPDGTPLPESTYPGPAGGVCERREDPLYGLAGLDPREHASAEVGRDKVEVIVATLAVWVRKALEAGA